MHGGLVFELGWVQDGMVMVTGKVMTRAEVAGTGPLTALCCHSYHFVFKRPGKGGAVGIPISQVRALMLVHLRVFPATSAR